MFTHKEWRRRSKLTHQSFWADLLWRSLNWPQFSSFTPHCKELVFPPHPPGGVREHACLGDARGALLHSSTPPTSFLPQQMQGLVSIKFVSQSWEEGNEGRETAYQNALPKRKWFLWHMCYWGRGDDSLLPFQEQFPELSVGGFTWHILKPNSILCCVCSLFTSQQQWISTSLYLSLTPSWLSDWVSRLPCL